ncbi:Protein CBR-HRG-3 [Caenorhabditis briggsae]|uniref:Protein CBR-HRG-3 n=1 Tax=Caenorhabditis briggsae TaxID=6238 RepID=B6IL30_CAEBR|nr:Protein CBR-HRG-3 [Caenorhabditis briggsae]CAS00663.1 Protein CBR-HRG-3 [Caenorhabditis briggsae]
MVNYSKHFVLFSILILILVHLSIVESVPTENGFWTNVYFVITASDSFFGG